MVGTTEHIRIGQLEIRFLLEGAATAGSLAMFEFDVPANARVPIAHLKLIDSIAVDPTSQRKFSIIIRSSMVESSFARDTAGTPSALESETCCSSRRRRFSDRDFRINSRCDRHGDVRGTIPCSACGRRSHYSSGALAVS